MALDGFPGIRQPQLWLKAPCRLPMENDQWWKTFGHCRLSEGTLHTAWRGDWRTISCFSWESKRALDATKPKARGPQNDCYLKASRHHWQTLSEITHKDNHFTAKGQIWVLHDVAQSPVYCLGRCCVGASSQTINFASYNSSIESLYPSIEHIESLPMAIGILKTKCEVRPPSNRKVVMSEKATSMATCPSHQTNANNTLYTKVFCDPPKLSKKNTTPWAIALNTTVTVVS